MPSDYEPPRANSKQESPMSMYRLTLLTCAMTGVQVSYAAQVNLGTPHLLLLGLPHRLVSLAWVAGPLSGLIVQPIVGRLSDNSRSRFGRRRPFLVIGALLTAAAMLLFSSSSEIATALHMPRLSLPIAIVAFFMLDFSVQAVQAPLRALVTDIVPTPQRPRANALLGVFTGAGQLLAGALTGANITLPFHASHTQVLFAVSAAVLVGTVAICVLATREPAWDELPPPPIFNAPERDGTQDDPTTDALISPSSPTHWKTRLRDAPRPFWATFAVQLCTWVGFFTLFVYVTSWVGHNVYMGDGSAPQGSKERLIFEKGVRLGGRANAVQAMVTVACSLALPFVWRRVGVRAVYVFGQLVEAASLLAAPLLRGRVGQSEPAFWLKVATMFDIASFGVVWATTMSVPWTLVGDALESDAWYRNNVGTFQTIFNASQSGPQLIVALIVAPVIMMIVGDDAAWVMFAGGAFGLLGAILVLVLGVNEVEGKRSVGMARGDLMSGAEENDRLLYPTETSLENSA